jgi:UDP-N-acetyl-D-mannosaminuronic acid dehydrogenase
MKSICILGLGYIGLPTAAMFATHGYQVYGVDINDGIVKKLNHGEIHIEEPGLKEAVQAAIHSGNLCANCSPQAADAFIISVPTPFKHDEYGVYEGRKYKLADMQAVTSAAESIVPHLRKGALVILESTSPVLTTVGLVQPILEQSGLKAGKDFYLAYSPERVLPGQILKELVENARVIGGIDPESAEKGKALYSAFVKGEIVLTDATTAEMVKLMENTYRDVNIAIANEFARLANRFGVNVSEAISIANRHPRVKILNPGPGVGGHCISIDPWFLVESAPDLCNLIHTTRIVNDTQPEYVVSRVIKTLDGAGTAGKTIGLVGLTYKANTDDIRESPSMTIADKLRQAGFHVVLYDPHVNGQINGFTRVESLQDLFDTTDVIAFLVAHDLVKQELSRIPMENLETKVIFDFVSMLPGESRKALNIIGL